ncbi:hypothetical protein [Sphingobacterium sp. IITKGP-BTPF85]|uniref:hypothetical protein n=1 Tax=Sphingobacterium sp. IITKGP-BTPF85 TaxID=1338009 RepID=UPI00038A1C05|nr:hypothetical protein [Sphingobacterium sp. IITKGP-BTPF85]KKX46907.1 hypothetical protein L950_0229370 [Sphingobacterium sp. IITKGP-BTPF85]
MLKDIFIDKSLKRLERYVVGVLWGEAFTRKGYFKSSQDTQKFREQLELDKDSDSYNHAATNLGSKLDFVNLIKTLSDDESVEIIEYDKNLISFVNEQLEIIQPKFIKELEKIAEKTNDSTLLKQVQLTEDSFKQIEKEKEDALIREEEERKRRIDAENRAYIAEQKRIEAERKQRDEKDRRKKAESDARENELKRREEEVKRKEEEVKRKEAEQKAKEEKDKT